MDSFVVVFATKGLEVEREVQCCYGYYVEQRSRSSVAVMVAKEVERMVYY